MLFTNTVTVTAPAAPRLLAWRVCVRVEPVAASVADAVLVVTLNANAGGAGPQSSDLSRGLERQLSRQCAC